MSFAGPKYPIGVHAYMDIVWHRMIFLFDDPATEACALAMNAYWSNPDNELVGTAKVMTALGFSERDLQTVLAAIRAAFPDVKDNEMMARMMRHGVEIRVKDRG